MSYNFFRNFVLEDNCIPVADANTHSHTSGDVILSQQTLNCYYPASLCVYTDSITKLSQANDIASTCSVSTGSHILKRDISLLRKPKFHQGRYKSLLSNPVFIQCCQAQSVYITSPNMHFHITQPCKTRSLTHSFFLSFIPKLLI